jgi:hypothetical protein
LTSPRNSMDWRAALDILREMQVEEVAPDLPLCRGMVSASGLNSLLLSCHTEINHEKGWCIWSSIFWDTWELHIFVVLWRLRVVPPFGFFNKKVSHGLPPSAPRIIFVGLLPNLVGYMGGSIHWGYPNSWMEENGQSF